MSKLKQKINSAYNQAYNHQTNLDELKQKLEILPKKERNLFMKTKKFFILSTCSLILVAAIIVLGCSLNKNETTTAVKDSVITMELNPSISLTVNDEGIVTSVYGNNDEGKMIIVDEEENLVGKSSKIVINKILEIEVNCGYFVIESTDEKYNNLNITIDCELNTNEINALVEELTTNITTQLQALNVSINEKITFVKNNTKEYLVNTALKLDPSLTFEEANQLSNKQLLAKITASYLELSKLPTQEIVDMYLKFKEYELNIAEISAFQTILTSTSTINNLIVTRYNEFLTKCNEKLQTLEQTYYIAFIAEDSEYQQKYHEIITLKAEVLKLRTEVEKLEDGLEKTNKLAKLSIKETKLTTEQTTLELIKLTAETGLNMTITAFNTSINSINSFIISNEELNSIMINNANQISQKINEQKTQAFEHFETTYKDDIISAYNQLKTNKQLLIDQLNNYSSNK